MYMYMYHTLGTLFTQVSTLAEYTNKYPGKIYQHIHVHDHLVSYQAITYSPTLPSSVSWDVNHILLLHAFMYWVLG